ncbi:MAG TPA: hypothetical protein VLT13_10200 [Bacteroidota bacterium]|nr:hypothetical protein [Bacteroidota bacterium]
MNRLRVEPCGRADCRVRAGETLLAEIRDLRLCSLRLQEDGPLIIGPDVPMPLFWEQYADHENPERNASSGAVVSVGRDGDNELTALHQPAHEPIPTGPEPEEPVCIVCRGTNSSGSIRSTFRLTFSRSIGGEYQLSVHALLEVTGEEGWLITPNPHHGELEFCNIWPAGTFSVEPGQRKRYAVTAVRRGERVTLVRHTHLESADKHRIMLQRGDCIAWLLEDVNPVITLESDLPASAGLCAYMWDVHVAYPVCQDDKPCVLPRGFTREARFCVSGMPRGEGESWLEKGKKADSPEDDRWPVYVPGLNTFRTTFASAPGEAHTHWPWAFEVVDGAAGSISGMLDQSTGFDDQASLCIRSSVPASGRWMATTLGPAFGGPPFRTARRYRLSARVRTLALEGESHIALRIHRSGQPDLYNAERYEMVVSPAAVSGTAEWQELSVVTQAIVPEPDRVHILLVHKGKGTSWFDNVLFEELD